MGKRGPKTFILDEVKKKEFERLCHIQTTLEEVAAWFGVSEDTIERAVKAAYKQKFAEVYAQKRGQGRVSLRRSQFQNALKGNTTMQIWLGKQYLNQTDKFEEVENEEKPKRLVIDWEGSLQNLVKKDEEAS